MSRFEIVAQNIISSQANKAFEKKDYGFVLYVIVVLLSWLFQAVSMLSSSTLVYGWSEGILKNVSWFNSVWIAGIITAGVVLMYELLKREATRTALLDYFDDNILKTSNLLTVLAFTAGSVAISWYGTYDVVKVLEAQPVYAEPTLLSPADFADYDVMIAKRQKEADDFLKANTYQGKLDKKRGLEHSKMLKDIQRLREEKMTKVQSIYAENKARTDAAKMDYEGAVLAWEQMTDEKGFNYAKVVSVTEILFLLCMFYIYYVLDKNRIRQAETPVKQGFQTVTNHYTERKSQNAAYADNRQPIGFKNYDSKEAETPVKQGFQPELDDKLEVATEIAETPVKQDFQAVKVDKVEKEGTLRAHARLYYRRYREANRLLYEKKEALDREDDSKRRQNIIKDIILHQEAVQNRLKHYYEYKNKLTTYYNVEITEQSDDLQFLKRL